MQLSQWLEGALGFLVVVSVLWDVFLAVIVPRRAPRAGRRVRINGSVIPHVWRLWRWIGLRISAAERREVFLGTYSSFAVVLLLVFWVVGLVTGYGLLIDAMRAQIKPEPTDMGASR